MTRFSKWLRKRVEKWLDRYYEGPEVPPRFSQYVIDFMHVYPQATKRQWLQFALRLAEESYKSGFVRGFENAERDESEPEIDPDVLADATMPGWRARPMSTVVPDDMDDPVQDQRDEGYDLEVHLSEMNRG